VFTGALEFRNKSLKIVKEIPNPNIRCCKKTSLVPVSSHHTMNKAECSLRLLFLRGKSSLYPEEKRLGTPVTTRYVVTKRKAEPLSLATSIHIRKKVKL
jgi:hypothetical protein